jgi:internalin A
MLQRFFTVLCGLCVFTLMSGCSDQSLVTEKGAAHVKAGSGPCGSEAMYLRGSFNDWQAFAMTCSNNIWSADVYLTKGAQFKFELTGLDPWGESWGDNVSGRTKGNALLGGANIVVSDTGYYHVTFDYRSSQYFQLFRQPSFIDYCRNEDAPESLRRTVEILKIKMGSQDCEKVQALLLDRTSLDLSWSDLTDLRPLIGLVKLEQLILNGNWQLEDISVLSLFHNLVKLDLSTTVVTDLSSFKNMAKLKELYLGNCFLKSIKGIEGSTQLKVLDLSQNQLTDVTALGALSGLEELDLSRNEINNITPLAGLTNLKRLLLSAREERGEHRRVASVQALQGLKNLEYLDVRNNVITDLSVLTGADNLKTLLIGANPIRDYSFIAALGSLATLDMSGSQVKDLSFLKEMTSLKRLVLSNSAGLSLSGIEGAPWLAELVADRCKITDLAPLEKNIELKLISFNENEIVDLTALKHLAQLEHVLLRSNRIESIAPLAQLSKLRTLELTDNPLASTLPRTADNCPYGPRVTRRVHEWCMPQDEIVSVTQN